MPLRLVFDTNVWLDWLVFQDPDVEPLRLAMADGAAVFIDAGGLAELARALGYRLGRWSLDVAAQESALAACRDIARVFEHDPGHAPGAPLPTCRDPDDQKFLELARDCAADVLVTHDRALLDLARPRASRRLPFRIQTPREFASR
ncbi:MAG: putative toxin-antitoxin system toxin component, PIN family [Burkholderiales bacterium]